MDGQFIGDHIVSKTYMKGIQTYKELWLSWVWWVKCILRYIPPSEGVERTTKTQRTQRLIDPM
jgi:hypothetical protein